MFNLHCGFLYRCKIYILSGMISITMGMFSIPAGAMCILAGMICILAGRVSDPMLNPVPRSVHFLGYLNFGALLDIFLWSICWNLCN